jgi:hypothetical protein
LLGEYVEPIESSFRHEKVKIEVDETKFQVYLQNNFDNKFPEKIEEIVNSRKITRETM